MFLNIKRELWMNFAKRCIRIEKTKNMFPLRVNQKNQTREKVYLYFIETLKVEKVCNTIPAKVT